MPCMKKIYNDKEGAGPLVSTQERRAAIVLQINRSSTARQPVVVFFDSLYMIRFSLFVLPPRRPGQLFSVLGVENERSCPGCPAPPRPGPALPSPAPCHPVPPCPTPPRPARGMSGFWILLVLIFPDIPWIIKFFGN